jgi:hypothetical protein
MYGTMIPKSVRVVVMVALGFLIVVILILAWAPWIDDEEIHDRVLRERAHIDGTMGWLTQPDGSKVYTLICDYEVHWAPFGRWVASCEGGYYVTFWGEIK